MMLRIRHLQANLSAKVIIGASFPTRGQTYGNIYGSIRNRAISHHGDVLTSGHYRSGLSMAMVILLAGTNKRRTPA
jgi:hypothetical protein